MPTSLQPISKPMYRLYAITVGCRSENYSTTLITLTNFDACLFRCIHSFQWVFSRLKYQISSHKYHHVSYQIYHHHHTSIWFVNLLEKKIKKKIPCDISSTILKSMSIEFVSLMVDGGKIPFVWYVELWVPTWPLYVRFIQVVSG